MNIETTKKRIHGEPEPVNVPLDMVAESPVPCGFKVGDAVVFTNDYGVSFDLAVRGFAKVPHGQGRLVYLNTTSWWFPVSLQSLKLLAR